MPTLSGDLVGLPSFDTLGEVDLFGAFGSAGTGVLAALLLVFSLLLADFFDTMGTMTAIGAEASLNDEEGTPPHAQRILVVDSVAAIAGGAAGVSSNTSYIESASGVGEGARTGLASVVTGVLFLLATFFTPLVAAIPSEAAVPALVLVGLPDDAAGHRDRLARPRVAIPAFLTVVLMPFTYSISVGIGAGFVAYVCIKVVVGKARRGPPAHVGRRGALRRLLRLHADQRLALLTAGVPREPGTSRRQRSPVSRGSLQRRHRGRNS